MNNTRRLAALALVAVLAATGTACSANGGSMKVSGNCGLGKNPIAVEKVLPTSVLEKLLGDGDYQAIGGLVVRDGKLPAAYAGDCALQDSDGQDALRLALINKADPRYADAQKALASGDQDGFSKIDEHTYVIPDDGKGAARGVSILPDRLVILRVLQPADGVDASKEVGPALATVVDRVQNLS